MSEYYFLEDLAERSGLTINAVRYYVKIGLIKPIGGGSGLQYFGEDAIKRLRTIKKLRRQDTSVQQIIAMMRKEVK